MRGREVIMLRTTLGEGNVQYPMDFDVDQDERLLAEARVVARRRAVRQFGVLAHPRDVSRMLRDTLVGHTFEVFGALFLDARHVITSDNGDSCSFAERGWL